MRENNENISGVILARGTYEDMERLTRVLEDLADKRYDTDYVLCHIQRVINASGSNIQLQTRPEQLSELPESDEANDTLDESVEANDVILEKKKIMALSQKLTPQTLVK